jgi:hypothetical protein
MPIMRPWWRSPLLRIESASIGLPPRDVRAAPTGSWLRFTLRVSDNEQLTRGYWQSYLIAGLMRDESRARCWPEIVGQAVRLHLPDGENQFDSQGIIGSAFASEIAAVPEAQIEHDLRQNLEACGLSLESVQFDHPFWAHCDRCRGSHNTRARVG